MRLAVRKEEGRVPGGGFHYMVHPIEMKDDFECDVFRMIGYTIINITDWRGAQLLKDANVAMMHQIEIAPIVDKAEKDMAEFRAQKEKEITEAAKRK